MIMTKAMVLAMRARKISTNLVEDTLVVTWVDRIEIENRVC